MIALGITLGYFAIAVLASRPLYGILRARSIDKNIRDYPALYTRNYSYYSKDYDGVNIVYWNKHSQGEVKFATILLCLAWPVFMIYPIGMGIQRYMTGTKIKSNSEIEAERTALSKRITELEKELKIVP